MFSRFERLIAGRYLRAKQGQRFASLVSGFSVLGIFLGVAALIIVSSLMNGFRDDLESQLVGLDAHIEITRRDGDIIASDLPLIEDLRTREDVALVSLVARDQVVLMGGDGRAEALTLRGLAAGDMAKRPQILRSLAVGTLEDFSGWSLFVTRQASQRLREGQGGEVDMISPLGNTSPLGWVPRIKRLPIAGVLDFRRDQATAFLPLDKAQIFLRQKGGGQALELFLTEAGQARALRKQLAAQLGADYIVEDWMALNETLVTALDVERVVVVLILTLIMVVAAFSIVSSQVMLVRSKGAGIAILRTMGASRGAVARAFVLAGLRLGLMGVGAGLALGLLMAWAFTDMIWWLEQRLQGLGIRAELAYLAEMPVNIQGWQVAGYAIFSLILTLLATLYPAWRAASLDPVEALRND